jgi:hypothetical protein
MSNRNFRIFAFVFVFTALLLNSPRSAQSNEVSSNEATFDKLIETIFPKSEEEKWRQTPWVPSISTGRQMAHQRKRPLFLWAMNGDPLGCV